MFRKLFSKKVNKVDTMENVKGYKITWFNMVGSDKNGYDSVKTYEQAENKKDELYKNNHITNVKIIPIY